MPGWQQACSELDSSAPQQWGMIHTYPRDMCCGNSPCWQTICSCCDLPSLSAAGLAKWHPSIMVALTCHWGQARHSRVWLCDGGITQFRIARGRKLTVAVRQSLISAVSVQ